MLQHKIPIYNLDTVGRGFMLYKCIVVECFSVMIHNAASLQFLL